MTEPLPILLIHGAWHGAWCWSELVPLLETAGRTVVAPDLPGHGADSLPPEKATLTRYVDSLRKAMDVHSGPWIVVAHSMAGIPATVLSACNPDRVAALVYLNAYIPCSGDSIFSLMEALLPDSDISRAMQLSEDRRTISLARESICALFCNASAVDLQKKAGNSVRVQGSLPLSQRARFEQSQLARVRRVAVCSNADRVIPTSLQRALLKRQPCDEFIMLEGDHSLFFSATAHLAQLILAQ